MGFNLGLIAISHSRDPLFVEPKLFFIVPMSYITNRADRSVQARRFLFRRRIRRFLFFFLFRNIRPKLAGHVGYAINLPGQLSGFSAGLYRPVFGIHHLLVQLLEGLVGFIRFYGLLPGLDGFRR